ncbi:hypothetical protein pW4_75 [Bacillus phage pW4]|uniref:Uncharacterized protein n=1 Tax=Bacillus phage pW4 TaxID=2500560 RepID=A0A3Q9R7N7_9CAUD|nr:hypothetical protein PP656_gp064 [Bacillus phage pW4]AZU99090.1 hypothetical protein pW4_75 [Bacillus phage pW4]
MITYTDGTIFRGVLAAGQTWVKGNRERTIVKFDDVCMYYTTKKSKGVKVVYRSSFRNWLTSGAMLKK